MILGLTGSLGSGKSFVSSLLAACNAQVVCADRIAREVVQPGSKLLNQLLEVFGANILLTNGSLDRERLARLVFADSAKRKALEGIIHPAVRQRELELLEEYRNHPLVVLDVPLLYEAKMQDLCDQVAVVTVDENTRCERLMAQRNMTPADIRARLAAQMPQQEKVSLADFVIDNSGTRSATAAQVRQMLNTIFPEGLPAPLMLDSLAMEAPGQ